ncbi:hypothetical protein A2763_00665 [Candidatus Kaiserbacteria bacterium RIFCSPHIGHO2_01_FULL_54_36]|uniref:Uncharacterized protein n=1 Tax=Candidatus Kaiserbacteria bacterium RIFCSPHIGHO2_01_FULL_54_36 TaxID=1798482 RepID=A0A1F6CNT0_9BACT|nr:MAG: hypothetical protein A2763_00665 [Candidatus Kaiserbacteria bacterium RIFCSPHIGHO2_01_FULL_54_36]OGG75543.1 MAG: hypothetical protein A3A41_02870 [Candidatus Kaiserbacteria bacterium RIFCSPLOWO2_01_FULL_54_22]
MPEDNQIVEFYISEKLSETQVAARLSIAPKHVRRVLNRHKVSRRTRSEAIRYLYITKFNKKPFDLKKDLSKKEQTLKIAGVMLYWGEGSKRGNTVALANSDPAMVLVFMKFLRDICGIDKNRIRATIHYYGDHDPQRLLSYWSRITRILAGQFYKPFLHADTKGTYKKKSQYGTISVQYSDKKLLELINGWIQEYQNLLIR